MRALVWVAGLTFGITGCETEPRGTAAPAPSAPDSFLVAFETSAGEFRTIFHHAWSPLGVERVYELAHTDFYAGARFYRVNDRYAQFGYTGRPAVDSVWVASAIPDEPPVESNGRGMVSFARGGPETRSVILFINRGDNSNLDSLEWNGVLGFPPVGRVVAGMAVVDALYDGYGEEPMGWEDSIAAVGNAFLDRRFPRLDSIIGVRIVDDWR